MINSENFIYSKINSRPSKSLIDPELYTKYKESKLNFNLFENIKDLIFKECIGYVFLSSCKINDYIYTLDGITYKFIDSNNHKFKDLTDKLNDKYYNYIILINDIYSYPKIQYIYIMSSFFKRITIIWSQITNCNIIICTERLSNLDIKIDNLFVKDFNIKVDDTIIKYIKQNNSIFHENFIRMNESINDSCNNISQISIINKELDIINKYYKNYINKNNNKTCSCNPNSIFYSNLLTCYVCENCLTLTSLFFVF
tara:strand:- start:522 stop:1286 length:765 start_codon:yes stop_codon:yes gene_type:complete